jgi:hypothetical protein
LPLAGWQHSGSQTGVQDQKGDMGLLERFAPAGRMKSNK